MTLQNDTIRGQIVSKTNSEMWNRVEFVQDGKAGKVTFSPADLTAFGFDGGRTFMRLSFNGEEVNFVDSAAVFVRRSVEGKIGLYILDNARRRSADMFLINHQTHVRVHLSKPREKEISLAGGTYISQSGNYLRLLQLVKGETSSMTVPRYRQKEIERDIVDYNRAYADEYPVSHYKFKTVISHRVAIGFPTRKNDDPMYRCSYYLSCSWPEQSRRLSYQAGILYDKSKNGRLYTVIPIGFEFHAASGRVRPYLHLGLAAQLARYRYDINDFFVGINSCVGVKLKIGRLFLHADITLSGQYGSTIGNFGLSF